MKHHRPPAWPALFALVLLPLACGPVEEPSGLPPGDPPAVTRDTFEWAPVVIDGLTPSWGGVFAPDGDGDGGLRVGGVTGSEGPVTGEIVRLTSATDDVATSVLPVQAPASYCGCTFYDPGRDELLSFGGRDGFFQERDDASRIAVEQGTAQELESDVLPAPVGCTAVFFPELDVGYLFGGAGAAGFSDDTFRYDPATRTLTPLEIDGPPARYDAALKPTGDHTAVLVGGMGRGSLGVRFFADVWTFDAASETWSEVTTSGGPAGRREPWLAVAPDDDTLVMGFGTDTADGSTALGDLWSLRLSTGEWEELDVAPPAGGEAPTARGFVPWLPGPTGSAGLVAGGYNGVELVPDAFVLLPPDELAGVWR